MMLTRRAAMAFAAFSFAMVVSRTGPAAAQTQNAAAFVQDFGTKLIGVVNGDESTAAKEQALRPMIDKAVDVDAIARFCLGRFVNIATPQQMTDFTKLFHSVLVDNITSKIGQFRGVTFKMTDTTMRGDEALVGTIVQRPNEAPTNVRWVVSTQSGAPKIVDVIAEGTSLRLTQRSDYAAYLSHHGDQVSALITAMRQQLAQN